MMNMNRRSFVKNSLSALSVFSLPNVLGARDLGQSNKKSVIWIWMGGGASHFETFNVNNDDVVETYRSVNGFIRDPNTGIQMGGLWTNLIGQADKLNVVASFSHGDSAHEQATHFVNTGHYQTERAQTPISKYPSYGSIVSNVFGANSPNGMPTYVAVQTISGDGPAWLGGAYKPFSPSAKKDLGPSVELDRFSQRGDLLNLLDIRDIPGAKSLDKYKEQAYNVVMGDVKAKFNTEKNWAEKKALYGDSKFGENLLLAKQLVGGGSKFITVNTGVSWDYHTDIKKNMERAVPNVDRAIAGLIQDLYLEGQSEEVMVIVTTEFGRTKLNNTFGSGPNGGVGRDHNSSIVPLVISGGSFASGRVIGQTDKNNTAPEGTKFGPIDLQHTIFDHLGIDRKIQRFDNAGRPRYLLESGQSGSVNILT